MRAATACRVNGPFLYSWEKPVPRLAATQRLEQLQRLVLTRMVRGLLPLPRRRRKLIREADTLVDLSNGPLLALHFLGDSLAGHGYLGGSYWSVI